MFQVKAIIHFRGRNEDELTIRPGDVLTVNSEETIDDNLWYDCKNQYGETGLVLADRVQLIPRRNLVEQQDIGDEFDNLNIQSNVRETFPTQYNEPRRFRRSNSGSVSPSSFTSTNSSQISNQSMPYVAYAPKYNGSTSINEWINLAEMDFKYIQNDQEKVERLRTYLEGDAQSWYAQDIAKKYSSITWEQCKQEMIVRFSSNEVRPIIGAIHRVWKEDDNIKKYYMDKMTYLSQLDYMPDIDKVALLTFGMPHMSRIKFTAANLSTPSNWLNYGSQLEAQLGLICERREFPVRSLNDNNEILAVTDLA